MSAEEIRKIITLLENTEDWQVKDAAMKMSGKKANEIMLKQVSNAGIVRTKASINNKAVMSVHLNAYGGVRFNHYVPLAQRPNPDKSAPPYVAFTVSVDSSGETFRQSEDGPIDESKNYFYWGFEWKDHAPTLAEMQAKIPDLRAALLEAKKIFEDKVAEFSSKY